MNNKFLKIGDNRGTALITAFLMMGVLVAVSLVLSILVIREVKITKDFLSSGKAYYAAESGVEEALYHLKHNLPGWQPGDPAPDNYSEKEISPEAGTRFKYILNNTCNSYPCTDDFDMNSVVEIVDDSVDYSVFYDVLDLSENITIPMFIVENVEGESKVKSIEKFVVQYYANFDPKNDLKLEDGLDISGWDVLRWKIFGMKDDDGYKTDSINDFSAISPLAMEGGQNDVTKAGDPSWFGTESCQTWDQGQRTVKGIKCTDYSSAWNVYSNEPPWQTCLNTDARNYYQYNVLGEVELVMPCYPIIDFMGKHLKGVVGATGMNYLSLTNMMNPAMFKDAEVSGEPVTLEKKRERSKIYFRVEAYKEPSVSIAPEEDNVTDKFVREYADITSDGYSGDAKQSVNVKIKRDSYMPVFNFAIYSTYMKDGEEPYYEQSLYKSVDYFK